MNNEKNELEGIKFTSISKFIAANDVTQVSKVALTPKTKRLTVVFKTEIGDELLFMILSPKLAPSYKVGDKIDLASVQTYEKEDGGRGLCAKSTELEFDFYNIKD